MKKLIIISASGHGKVVADIATLCGYKDIDKPGTYVGVPVRKVSKVENQKIALTKNRGGIGLNNNTQSCFLVPAGRAS